MKRNLTSVIIVILFFCFLTIYIHPLPPRTCPQCWEKFNKSSEQRIFPVTTISKSKYEIGLTQLRSTLEKARIGDTLSLELILGKDKVVKLGIYTPVILSKTGTILEEYRGMDKVSFSLPEGINKIPATGVLVIKTTKDKINSIKTIQLDHL